MSRSAAIATLGCLLLAASAATASRPLPQPQLAEFKASAAAACEDLQLLRQTLGTLERSYACELSYRRFRIRAEYRTWHVIDVELGVLDPGDSCQLLRQALQDSTYRTPVEVRVVEVDQPPEE